MRIKICGITNLEDALFCARLGADALGFIFASSPRKISLSKAQEIIKGLPPFISSVGVFVNEKPAKIKETAQRCSLDYIQLHGEETADFCQSLFPQKIIKSIRIKDRGSLNLLESFSRVKAFLLDTYVQGKAGGTGRTFNWHLAKEAKKAGLPIILSGGLSPENVREAIKLVQPVAVDASSSLESSPGKKDKAKVEFFIRTIKKESLCC